ncbi:hypothetical protein TSTA_054860 [Talaromyces stipitatus ATCC 10500]|uniref:F-box domain protein n=1 Tax=Talaromyces stipitatus (strain ATCC 10500 / CBS 375.48 / QM 6759 / NRRL 1006) TaxID=441959 RepID=B8MR83_TALSN|nr:uncharacterized protein TSTA_054860 [Talaromyces stipitatus ATCC 10500]EED12978.1 hypothetical protein TSTA_054860 [Talaromyces stipitatus ATCC 10500]
MLGTIGQGGLNFRYQDKYVDTGKAGACRRTGRKHTNYIYLALVPYRAVLPLVLHMARLLDLPDELILLVVDYVQADTTQTALPFYKLGDAYRRSVEQNPPQRIKDLRSLRLVSARLSNLLKPIFYRNICIRENRFRNYPQNQLNWSLENDSKLKEHIISAIVPCNHSIHDVYQYFWFPNIQALSILRFNDWEPMEFEDDSHIGTSPVTALNLIGCGAHEDALAAVLSWPNALEVLHYDAEQVEWDGYYGDEPAKTWTCAAFVRTLQPQKATLRELTLTRPWLVHEGLGNGPRIDLSDFTALTTLRIYQVFLCGEEDPLEAWRSLPRNIEGLEVFYDDWELTRFDEDDFLRGLLAHKKEYLPHLRTVSINSPEQTWDSDIEEFKPAGQWTPPSPLARAFKTVGVNIHIWLGPVEPPKFEELDIPQLLEPPRKRR